MIEIAAAAQKKIAELIEQSEKQNNKPVKGLRVSAKAQSPLKVDYKLAFISAEQEIPEDMVVHFDSFDVYIDSQSASYLEEARIDYVDGLMGSGFKIESGRKLPPNLSGPLVERVQTVLDQQINPSVASHGGYVSLIDIRDDTVFLQFGGGCQGCGMVDVTLKQGIETAIKEAVPEITEVYDVTDHADGKNPYYQSAT